jgi:aryl-alcohol dehydrogenase-like predicted oxidoreductase
MHFGEALAEDRFLQLIQRAYERGIRTFMTADVYGAGQADELLGRALRGIPRDSYCLVEAIGHDFYRGQREGSKGFPRFTDPSLRPPGEYRDYLRMATEKALQRCQVDKFDLLLLHNPDSTGYSSEALWKSMDAVREAGLTNLLGVAPGPANGFTLDLLLCLERFAALIDWAMIILNPLEPWPGHLCLPAATQHDVNVMTRVVDYGGLFHDDVKPGHEFGNKDHRSFRPAGWVEAGNEKIEKLRPIARAHGLTLLQLACAWNLSFPSVKSVIPTLIQETGPSARSIESKLDELASLPEVTLTPEEIQRIMEIGDNTGCMALKGGNPEHTGESLPDRWPLYPDLERAAEKWGINPKQDLVAAH